MLQNHSAEQPSRGSGEEVALPDTCSKKTIQKAAASFWVLVTTVIPPWPVFLFECQVGEGTTSWGHSLLSQLGCPDS